MSDKQSGLREYFEELKRRKVVRVAISYIVGAWLLLQVGYRLLTPHLNR
jgi:hypothetical protein